MCCLYRGVAAEGGLWARLEAVGMSVEMSAGVLAARAMEGMQFTLGPTMAFRRETIRRMGGFKVTADYCADDFILGNETYKLGQSVDPQPSRHRPHGSALGPRRLAQAPGALDEVHALLAAQRPLRHRAHLQPALRPAGARRVRMARGIRCGASRFSPLPWPRALRFPSPSAASWCATPVGLACWCFIPIRDLMGFCFWAASYAGRRILWRGRVFELLPGGKMRASNELFAAPRCPRARSLHSHSLFGHLPAQRVETHNAHSIRISSRGSSDDQGTPGRSAFAPARLSLFRSSRIHVGAHLRHGS